MPHLAAQRCVLHPKAMLLLLINEPSQQLPLEKRRGRSCSCMYSTVCECALACVCNSTHRLNGKRERDGERIREGSRGVRWPFNLESLMWMTHIWLPKTMDSATHAIWKSDPSLFFFVYLPPPPPASPQNLFPQPSIQYHQHATTFFPPSPLSHITSSFLLPRLPLLVWAAAQPFGKSPCFVAWERIAALPSTPLNSLNTLSLSLQTQIRFDNWHFTSIEVFLERGNLQGTVVPAAAPVCQCIR